METGQTYLGIVKWHPILDRERQMKKNEKKKKKTKHEQVKRGQMKKNLVD